MSGAISTPVDGEGTPKVGLARSAVPAAITVLWPCCRVLAHKELREKQATGSQALHRRASPPHWQCLWKEIN